MPSRPKDGKLYFELRLLQIVARYHPIINGHSVHSSYRKSDRKVVVPTSGPVRLVTVKIRDTSSIR